MATMTIPRPDPMKEWIESQVEKGDYASTSDDVSDLVRRNRARQPHPELTIEDLRQIVNDARASGLSDRGVEDISAEALEEARSRGPIGE